jgi:hypothetical protein
LALVYLLLRRVVRLVAGSTSERWMAESSSWSFATS